MTDEVTLTPSQQRAIDAVIKGTGHVTISGPPGSGKTFLIKYLINLLGDKLGVVLAAPTHQAKIVLSEMTNMAASTIHSIMKIHPETYDDVKIFDQSKVPNLSEVRYLILDEGSMYDDDLVRITMKSIPPTCRVIVIGDKDQIQPVKHPAGVKSPFFTDKRFTQIHMTDIMRQSLDNPIIQVATDIRENYGWIHHNWNKENKTGVFKVNSLSDLINSYLRLVKTPEDLTKYRFLAYTNKTVNKINSIIRRHVYKTDLPYIEGEKIVLQEPYIIKCDDVVETIFNNGEVVTIKEITIVDEPIRVSGSKEITLKTAMLKVVSDYDQKEDSFTVLYGEDQQNEFDYHMSEAAGIIKEMPNPVAKRNAWATFWAEKEKFIETKSLGASTIHKSQGTTVTGVFLALHDLHYAEPDIQQQLVYVGLTRPTQFCLYYQ